MFERIFERLGLNREETQLDAGTARDQILL